MGQAAAIAPRAPQSSICHPRCPILLSLHGTGVGPLNQADSYKHQPRGEQDFVFGFDTLWTLAPDRHGAHNWEGIGSISADCAARALAMMTSSWTLTTPDLPPADDQRILYAGHSMGGHGAWLLAQQHPDRALGLLANAGWIKKEYYSVANKFMDHDVAVTHTDQAIKHVLRASVLEHEVDQHVGNLAGIPVLARVGGRDVTVHPFYTRRMVRLLHEHYTVLQGGVGTGGTGLGEMVEFQEVQGKEHWWWDTRETNDGGTMNDDTVRSFVQRCLQALAQRPSQHPHLAPVPANWTVYSANPAVLQGRGGVRITAARQPFQMARVQVSISPHLWSLTTSNCQQVQVSLQYLRTFPTPLDSTTTHTTPETGDRWCGGAGSGVPAMTGTRRRRRALVS